MPNPWDKPTTARNPWDREDISAPKSVPQVNIGSLTAAKAPSWLDQAEQDVTSGGGRTILGRVLGKMQGSDDGYSGVRSGVSEGASNFMASPLRGLLHAGQAAESIPEHPVKGLLGTVGGAMEAATIPSMIMGGPGATSSIEAVPSAKHAGQVFESVMGDAKNVPVNISNASEPLMRLYELGQRGSSLPKAVTQLAKRVTDPEAAPMAYQEARDFASKISQLSADEKMSLTPTIKAGLGNLRANFTKDIGDAAGVVGRGEDYANAMKEYAQAHTMKDFLTKALKYGAATAGAGAALSEGSKLLHLFGK